MLWERLKGGYYENIETGERVRGKKNLPDDAELVIADTTTTEDITSEPDAPAAEVVFGHVACAKCGLMKHTVTEKAYTCLKCGSQILR